jgi:serine/threonine protein kinase
MVSGTPAYLAPEVARGGKSSFAADVFSLGATLYAALEGAPPFGTDTNPMAILHRVASGELIPPRRSGSLTPLLLRMMAAEPADRPGMTEVARDLAARAASPSTGDDDAETTVITAALVQAVDPRPEPASAVPRHEADPGTGPAGTAPLSVVPLSVVPPSVLPPPVVPPSVLPPSVRSPSAAPPSGRPPSGRPPSVPPPADPRPARRPGARNAVLAVLAVVAVAAALVAFVLFREGDSGQTANPAGSSGEQPVVSSVATETSPSAAASSSAEPSTEVAGGPAADLANAVTGYYALMPGNTDAGWALLTPTFQTDIARNRESYDSFWGGIDRVVASDAIGTPPDSAEATITYYFKDGSVSIERTSYRLVDDGGVLKLDDSTVLSSRSG